MIVGRDGDVIVTISTHNDDSRLYAVGGICRIPDHDHLSAGCWLTPHLDRVIDDHRNITDATVGHYLLEGSAKFNLSFTTTLNQRDHFVSVALGKAHIQQIRNSERELLACFKPMRCNIAA